MFIYLTEPFIEIDTCYYYDTLINVKNSTQISFVFAKAYTFLKYKYKNYEYMTLLGTNRIKLL